MRAAYHVAFAVFSVGTVATPTTAPNATDGAGASSPTVQQHAVLDAARSIPADFLIRPRLKQEASLSLPLDLGASVGETLPETLELHRIPQHETYHYAVVNDRRVIVDAASRKIVYVIQ